MFSRTPEPSLAYNRIMPRVTLDSSLCHEFAPSIRGFGRSSDPTLVSCHKAFSLADHCVIISILSLLFYYFSLCCSLLLYSICVLFGYTLFHSFLPSAWSSCSPELFFLRCLLAWRSFESLSSSSRRRFFPHPPLLLLLFFLLHDPLTQPTVDRVSEQKMRQNTHRQ